MNQRMNGRRRMARVLLAAASAAAMMGAAYTLVPRPATVAVVDLRRVLLGLNQRAQAEADLKALGESLEGDMQVRQDEIRALDQKITDTKDPDERRRLQEERAFKTLDGEGWARLKAEEVDAERALLLQSLFRDIRTAAVTMATEMGYDVVLIDDSAQEFRVNNDSQTPRETQVSQQMNARRMLHVNPELDITDELITRMNNEFKAGS